jgi:ligand-binding sensor domain-containing protein
MGGGLVQFDETNGEATDIDAIVGRHDALGDQRVMALRLDRHDTLWIGTMASGLKKLDGRTGGSNPFRSRPAIRAA